MAKTDLSRLSLFAVLSLSGCSLSSIDTSSPPVIESVAAPRSTPKTARLPQFTHPPLPTLAPQDADFAALSERRQVYANAWDGLLMEARMAQTSVPGEMTLDFQRATETCMSAFAERQGGKVVVGFPYLPKLSKEGAQIDFDIEGYSSKLALHDPNYRERHRVVVLFSASAYPLKEVRLVLMLTDDAVAYWEVEDGSSPDRSKYEGLTLQQQAELEGLANRLATELKACFSRANEALK